MSFAPILDPAAYTSASEPKRRRALAAAAALQHMAADNATLLQAAMRLLDNKQPPAQDVEEQASPNEALQQKVACLSGVKDVLAKSGLPVDSLLPELVAQLRQVKAFGELDGGSVEAYIGPVGRLIRSGRIELFAGHRSSTAAS